MKLYGEILEEDDLSDNYLLILKDDFIKELASMKYDQFLKAFIFMYVLYK